MSWQPTTSMGALSAPIAATEPQFVRDGSRTVKAAWQEGELFEGMLLEELTGELARSGDLPGAEEESALTGEGGEGPLAQAGSEEGSATAPAADQGTILGSSLYPHVLSEALQRAGGLGLANTLAQRAEQTQSSASTTPSAAAVGGAQAPNAPALARSAKAGGAQPQ
jgi:hypothetical protein